LGLIALMALAFLALGLSPATALPSLWTGAFGDAAGGHLYPLAETLVKTCPLLLTGLGVVVAWRAGLFSIGGEGQLVMGALAATALAHIAGRLPGPLLTLLMLLVGIAAGAFWGAVAGWLRVHRNVQEVISTIMLNYVALSLLGWAVEGPLQEQAHINRQSDPLPDATLFARVIPAAWSGGVGTRLHSGVILAFLAAVVVSVLLFRTSLGFGLRLIGQNAEAARAARFPVDRLRLQAMAISGGLCGLAGVVELLGITGRLYAEFSPGWGYTAIPVALLGGLHPLGTALSAFFFGALTAGSGNLERFSGVSSTLINVIQAAAVLAVVGARAWRLRRIGSDTD
jgi:simple sugar transport system permease protein